MDSIDSPPSLSAPSNMIGPAAYSPTMSNSNNNAGGLNPSTAQMMPARFSFSSMMAPTPASVSLDSLTNTQYEGLHSHSASFNVDSVKKKRGRPRKYAPDGNISLGLSTTTAGSVAHDDIPDLQPKKARGRPRGSGKKQMNSHDGGCTAHIIIAMPGEDVAAKILSFSQIGQRNVFVISGNGIISNVILRHTEASSGCVSYEGQYEIITLSGSFIVSEHNGIRSKTGGLSVSLAGANGQLLGGGVAGMFMAGSQVQVILGSFVEDDKDTNPSMMNSGYSPGVPSQMMNFGGGGAIAAATAASPPPIGPSSGESSAENGSSPLNNRHPHPGMFDNNSSQAIQMQQQQQQQQQQMYHHHQIWAASQTQR